MEQFWSLFWSLIGIVATALFSWGTTMLIAWLNTKIKDKKLAGYATALTEIILNAVKAIAQTYVDGLKKEGKFDAQAAEEAKQKALDIINTQLTVELKKYIQDNFGDIEEYIKTQIEAMLYNLKH